MPVSLAILFRLIGNFFLDVVSAPVWWYSQGIVWILQKLGMSINEHARNAALGLWVRNIFVPMYGQYDAWGRIVSFVVRLANIIGRGIWVLIWIVVCIGVFLVWIFLPAAALYFFMLGFIELFN